MYKLQALRLNPV